MRQQTRQGIACIIGCLVVTVAGGFAGIGYLIYCAFFSGELAGEYELSTAEPTTFELTPEMSPVAITAGATFVVPRGQFTRKHAVYDGTLRSSEMTIWEGQFGGSIDDDEYSGTRPLNGDFHATRKYVLPAFSVEKSDTYTFTSRESFEPDLEVVGLSLSVRRNVREPNIPIVVTGCIALGLGILGLVFFGIRTIRGAVRS